MCGQEGNAAKIAAKAQRSVPTLVYKAFLFAMFKFNKLKSSLFRELW